MNGSIEQVSVHLPIVVDAHLNRAWPPDGHSRGYLLSQVCVEEGHLTTRLSYRFGDAIRSFTEIALDGCNSDFRIDLERLGLRQPTRVEEPGRRPLGGEDYRFDQLGLQATGQGLKVSARSMAWRQTADNMGHPVDWSGQSWSSFDGFDLGSP